MTHTLFDPETPADRAADLADRLSPDVRTACELFGGAVSDAPVADGLTDEEREAFEERAAIRQYDGGMSRDEAERAAWLDVVSGGLR